MTTRGSPPSRGTSTIIVPRSVFFDTQLYADLNASNPVGPIACLSYRQNATSAARNADDLQELITGNITTLDISTILGLLWNNANGVQVIGLTEVLVSF